MFLNFFTPQIYKKTNYTNFFFSDLLKKIKNFSVIESVALPYL